MTVYNKLVRDKIPQIIEQQGGKAETRILSGGEYRRFLEAKLDEEVGEYHRDQNPEELADILEVVYALGATLGCSVAELERIRQQKIDARGAFHEKILLISSQSG